MQIYFRLKSVFFSARNIWKRGKFCYIMTIYCCIRRRLSCRSVWPKTVTFQDRARIILCNIIFFSRNAQKNTATLGNSRRIFETYFKELCKEVIPQ